MMALSDRVANDFQKRVPMKKHVALVDISDRMYSRSERNDKARHRISR